MKVLVVLTYYRPHTSGLTIYAERMARGLVARGHQVTVLTSRFQRNLPVESIEDDVRVVRAPVAFRVTWAGVYHTGAGGPEEVRYFAEIAQELRQRLEP